jgi:hypothetical protein
MHEYRGYRYGEMSGVHGAVSRPMADGGLGECRATYLSRKDMSKHILRKSVRGVDWIDHGFGRSISTTSRVPSRLRQSTIKG